MIAFQRNKHALFYLLLCLLLILSALFPAFTPKVNAKEKYTDVTQENVHYQNILDAASLGFMGGYGDGSFKPDMPMPRANVVKALGKYAVQMKGTTLDKYDVRGVTPFTDVPATYPDKELYDYSLIVKKEGIFTGSNNKLNPKNLISRQQMAKVLVSAFGLKSIPGATSRITDLHLADPIFREYINILSENGITSVTEFKPTAPTRRGQFATFLVQSYGSSLENKLPEEPEDPLVPEDPELPEEPEPTPAKPLFVQEFMPIRGQFIILPQKGEVTYDDGSTKEHKVTWDDSHVNWREEGINHLVGNVEGTNLKAHLTVEIYYLPFILPNLIPYQPGPEVTKASNLIGKLSNDVKNADNASHATEIWRTANNAVEAVRSKFPEYDLSSWKTVLDREWKVIEQRQKDINTAKTNAQTAIANLLASKFSNYPTLVSEQRTAITAARNIVSSYETLDKKANTSTLHASIAKHVQRVNDLETAIGYFDNITLKIEDPTKEFVKAYRVTPNITDSGVHIFWRQLYDSDLNVTRHTNYWKIERRYITSPFTNHYADFSVQVVKGDAVLEKDFRVHVPQGNLLSSNPRAHFEGVNRNKYTLKRHQ